MTRSLSIVIPAYNEAERLPATLKRLRCYLTRPEWEFSEIVVVDDGSRDATVRVVQSMEPVGTPIRVLRNPGNRGKGYAVRNGIQKAQGEWTLVTDADLSTPIEELEKLWSAAGDSGAQVVIGSRALDRSLIGVHQPLLRESAGRVFNLAVRMVTGLPFKDTQCGFKLLATRAAREIFQRQQIERFGFDVEALVIARQLNYSVIEVPVQWNDVAGTKVSAIGGMAAFLDPLRVRWHQMRGRYR
ncbi:MAG TPA: dolichyl-phosphate beta-glucosyltransferase [Bryobacteraceae bacterium]|nr:dolichyl-phosphate beta-glucosyltransferase [Bryobacteraceae bacterium]